jgi:hypothetical protein
MILVDFLKPLTVLLILTTLIACEDSTGPQGSTPAYTLELMEESFNRQCPLCISLLDELLSDDFIFYFDINDIGQEIDGFQIPASWTRDHHMRACENMFEQAYSINLNFNTTGINDPEEGVPSFEANNVQTKILVMVNSTNGYLAQGFCDFEFANDASAGHDDWKVSKWYDRTGFPDSFVVSDVRRPSTLGLILAQYY